MRYKLLLSTFFALLAAALAWNAYNVTFENYTWLPQNNPSQVARDYVRDEFKPGEDLVVAVSLGQDYFDKEVLDELDTIKNSLADMTDVLDVMSPLHANVFIDHDGVVESVTYKEALDQGILSSLEDYKAHLKDSHYFGQLIAQDFKSMSVVVTLDIVPNIINYDMRDRIISEAESLFQNSRFFKTYKLSGETQLNHQMDVQTKSNLARLIILSVSLIVVFLYLIFRNVYKLLIIVFSAGITVLSSFAIISLRGHPLTVVSLILPVVIIVIAIADSIHILTRWDVLRKSLNDDRALLRETIRETWLPCLVTSITTGVGFGSFYLSELVPLYYFGADAFIAVFVAYLLIVSISWSGIYIFHRQLKTSNEIQEYKFLTNGLRRVHVFTQEYWKPILVSTCLLMCLFCYFLRNIYTETNFLDVFFKKESEIYKSFDYVDTHLGGSGNVDIVLKSDEEGYFKDVRVMQRVQALESELTQHKWVNYTQSYLNPLGMVHREFTGKNELPDTDDALAQELLFLEFSRGDQEKDVLSDYIDFDYSNARLHLQVPNLSANETTFLIQEANILLKKHQFPEHVYAGSSVFFQVLSKYVLETQIMSLVATLGVIWVLFIMIFGLKIGTIGMIPNVVPITVTMGSIAMLGIPFDFATVLIASISFGICVDDSIHFIHYYKWERDKGVPFFDRTRSTVRILGYPLVFTTLLLSIGFGVFMSSNLMILMKFGVFTVLAIVVALISDLIILPAALRLWDSKS